MRNYLERERRIRTAGRKAATAGAGRGARSLERDAADLQGVMTELLRVYQFRDRDRVGYHGLTITQCYVMELLLRLGALTLNGLAAEMRLDKSTLSRVVAGLERKGAVKRKSNPEDGRSILLDATAAGRRRYLRIEADLVAENAKVLAGFAPSVRRQLVRLIDELARAARERELTRVAEDAPA